MLIVFLRRTLTIIIIILSVFIFGIIHEMRNGYFLERSIIRILFTSIFITLYLGLFPIILSSLLTPLFKKTWKISNTPLKRDMLFGLIILILTPIFFYIYYEARMLAA